ncbi:MAG: serine--tRNA ligase, partial [Promethearchaeota archaeon]
MELFRNNLKEIIESEKKRFKDPLNAENVIAYDVKWRDILQKLEELKQQRNKLSKQIGEFTKSGDKEKAEKTKLQSREIKEKLEGMQKLKDEYYELREKFRYKVG